MSMDLDSDNNNNNNNNGNSLLTVSSSEYSLGDADKALVRMLLEDQHKTAPTKSGIDNSNIDKYEEKLDSFLKKLTSSTLERIPAETEQLMLDSVAVNDKLKVLAQQNYKTLLQNAACISNTFEGLNPLQSRLTFLSEKTPSLLDELSSFLVSGQETIGKWKGIQTSFKALPVVSELIEIPNIMETCIKCQAYEEALQLDQYTRKILAQASVDKRLAGAQTVLGAIAAQVDRLKIVLQRNMEEALRGPSQLPVIVRVVGLLRRLEVYTPLELRMAFLLCRDSYLRESLSAISEPSLYSKAIFPDDQISYEQPERSLLNSWITVKLDWYLRTLEQGVKDINEGNILANLLDQCMYTGFSLGRIGLDIRGQMGPIFTARVQSLFENTVKSAIVQFRVALSGHHFTKQAQSFGTRSGSSGNMSSISTPLKRTSARLTPSFRLLNHPILAAITNSITGALNELRSCAPLTLKRKLTTFFEASLREIADLIVKHAGAGDPAYQSSIEDFCECAADDMIPYFAKCFDAIWGSAAPLIRPMEVSAGIEKFCKRPEKPLDDKINDIKNLKLEIKSINDRIRDKKEGDKKEVKKPSEDVMSKTPQEEGKKEIVETSKAQSGVKTEDKKEEEPQIETKVDGVKEPQTETEIKPEEEKKDEEPQPESKVEEKVEKPEPETKTEEKVEEEKKEEPETETKVEEEKKEEQEAETNPEEKVKEEKKEEPKTETKPEENMKEPQLETKVDGVEEPQTETKVGEEKKEEPQTETKVEEKEEKPEPETKTEEKAEEPQKETKTEEKVEEPQKETKPEEKVEEEKKEELQPETKPEEKEESQTETEVKVEEEKVEEPQTETKTEEPQSETKAIDEEKKEQPETKVEEKVEEPETKTKVEEPQPETKIDEEKEEPEVNAEDKKEEKPEPETKPEEKEEPQTETKTEEEKKEEPEVKVEEKVEEEPQTEIKTEKKEEPETETQPEVKVEEEKKEEEPQTKTEEKVEEEQKTETKVDEEKEEPGTKPEEKVEEEKKEEPETDTKAEEEKEEEPHLETKAIDEEKKEQPETKIDEEKKEEPETETGTEVKVEEEKKEEPETETKVEEELQTETKIEEKKKEEEPQLETKPEENKEEELQTETKTEDEEKKEEPEPETIPEEPQSEPEEDHQETESEHTDEMKEPTTTKTTEEKKTTTQKKKQVPKKKQNQKKRKQFK